MANEQQDISIHCFSWKWYKMRSISASSGTVIMSLHGGLGRVIFGQDVHAVIEYLCDRGLLSKEKNCHKCGSLWELAAWRTSRTRPYSAAERSAARPPRVGAVVHSSRSQSSLWINSFTSFIYGACPHRWPRLVFEKFVAPRCYANRSWRARTSWMPYFTRYPGSIRCKYHALIYTFKTAPLGATTSEKSHDIRHNHNKTSYILFHTQKKISKKLM